jgi:PAS domain S-box-containing protein
VLAAALCLAATASFLAWTHFRVGGERATVAVDDIGQAAAALIAAFSCAWRARQESDRMRLVWGLLAASAGSWGLGEVVWSVYEVVLGIAVPFPSLADAGFLAAIPLAVAGVLAFPSAPSRMATQGRAIVDGATVALSLLFVSWALGLGEVYHSSASSLLAQWIGLAYPAGDVVIGTVLLLAISRTTRSQRGRLLLLLGGLAANSLADSAFAFLTTNGTYGPLGSMLDAGWVAGYLLIALAPLWPGNHAEVSSEEGPISPWQVAMPWIGILAVVVTVGITTAGGRPLDPFLIVPGGALAVLVIAGQILSYRDSLGLLRESRRAESQLKARTLLLNQVIEHAPQGIARIGRDRKITSVNPRMCALLKIGTPAILGTALERYLPADEVTRAFAGFGTGARSDDTFDTDSQATRPDGTKVWLHWSVTAVRAASAEIDYFLAMFDDINAEHEAEEAAMAHLTSLERLNHLKSEFVSTVSHEFRTALVGIQGFSEILADGDLTSADVQEFARDINHDAMRLSRMITDILDLDRMEAGKLALRVSSVNLNTTIRAAQERASTSSPQHLIRTDLDRALPDVSGDIDRLMQVMSNLLDNAIKYSPEGGDVVVISRQRDGGIQVTVKDQGIGIPADFADRLFGRYERFEDHHTNTIIGSGLGLAITRQIIEMHGGRIWVESKVGIGSEFTFWLPVDSPSANSQAPLTSG